MRSVRDGNRHYLHSVVAFLLLCGLLAGLGVLVRADRLTPGLETRSEPENVGPTPSESGLSQSHSLFIPLLTRRSPGPPPIFGVDMSQIDYVHGLKRAIHADVHWIHFAAFDWDRIEPLRTEPPTYHWEVVDENSLENAAEYGMKVIATIRFAPDWAQKYEGSPCGPIAEDSLDESAQFLAELVQRYSGPPYGVLYWELGNEPDAPIVYQRRVYGCWGEPDQEYWGGEYYAEMLKAAYPAIKEASPEARVLVGGLLMPCDPTHGSEGPDAAYQWSQSRQPDTPKCNASKFLEGILLNADGPRFPYFDAVSFHGYPLYDGSLQMDEHFPGWSERGGVVLGKLDYIRDLFFSYGVDKPIMQTEGSLLCPPENKEYCDPPAPEFYEAQADYVVWLYVRNWANRVQSTEWFQLHGPEWRHGSLLDAEQNPKPAYHALDFLTEELQQATYDRSVLRYPELRGYAFKAPGKRIWVLWAPDESPHTISLPLSVLAVFDKYGNELSPMAGMIEVQSPIYVELEP